MATPQEKFAIALKELKALQDNNVSAIYTDELSNRTTRELLLKNGFIKEVAKGWYISTSPAEKAGDTTSFYSSYWDFCARYLSRKFSKNWCLSPEQSVILHAGKWSVPTQLIVRSPTANNTLTSLSYNTSVFNLKAELPQKELITEINGLQLYSLVGSIIYSSASIFTLNPIETRTALSLIRDASQLLPILIEKGHSTIAGRLVGAFINMGMGKIADQIMETMIAAGYDVRETDPFDEQLDIKLSSRESSPFANRIKLLWRHMRTTIIEEFPPAPGLPENYDDYLKAIDEVYLTDAYHSLSIERYRVTPDLIERVSSGEWGEGENEVDKQQRDAMAARGYYQCFQLVKESIKKILSGKNSGSVLDEDHQRWYRQLFDPSVTAGILKAGDLAGYRSHQVYIGGSKHMPFNVDAMRDTMPVFFELLEQEPEASVRAVLGHFIFVFIHPYMDGNGRIGRFIMNAMLASGGYPWTVIPVEQREAYMKALETASVSQDIGHFCKFLAELVNKNIEGKPVAHLP